MRLCGRLDIRLNCTFFEEWGAVLLRNGILVLEDPHLIQGGTID